MSIAAFIKCFFGLVFTLIAFISADIKSGYKLPVSKCIYSLILILVGMTFYGAIYL
jgi:ABC-type Na+ efflux pump permease subunit